MKRLLIVLAFISMQLSSIAYDKGEYTWWRNRSSFSIGLLCNLKYQKAIGNYFSLGLSGKYFTDEFMRGYRADLFSRFYPFGVFEYLYIQPKFSVGQNKIIMNYTMDGTRDSPGFRKSYYSKIIGGGLDVGVNVPLSKSKKVFFDFSLGYNYYPFPKNIPTEVNNYFVQDETKKYGIITRFVNIGKTRWNAPVTGIGSTYKLSLTLGFIL